MWRWLEFLWFNYILSWRQALNILHWEIIFQHDSIITVSAPDKNSSNSFFSNFMCWVNLSVEWEEGINYNKLGNYKLFHHKKVENIWVVGVDGQWVSPEWSIISILSDITILWCHSFVIISSLLSLRNSSNKNWVSFHHLPGNFAKISCIMSQKLNEEALIIR